MPVKIQLALLLTAIAAIAAIAPSPAASSPAGSPPPARPNILFLYTDDQARWGMGAYGNPEVRTPHLDRLAAAGALFLNAFTITPVCSPSRASMFTGKYPGELGIEDWIDPGTEPEVGLDPAAVTWPKLLRRAGYRTALLGKWHLGTAGRFHPLENGFDLFYGFRDGANRSIDPTLEVEGRERRLAGSLPDLLAGEGIRFLKENRGRPFLLSVHFRAPHAPYAPVPEVDSKVFEGLEPGIPPVAGLPVERVRRLTREYYASIHSVDRNVGRLLEALDDLDLAASTLVIFTSDHGYMIGHHGLHHKGNATWLLEGKQGRRPNFFDDAIRVPMAVRWPGVVKPGTRIEEAVSNLDFFPTILEAAGVELPEGSRPRGRSFLPLLKGEKPAEAWPAELFGQYDMRHGLRDRMRMLRTPRWKLVRHFESGLGVELYDLRNDPGELHDLAGSPEAAATRGRLLVRLRERMAAAGDPLLEGMDDGTGE